VVPRLASEGGLAIYGTDGAMQTTDQKQARRIVSGRLRLFFSQLKEQLAPDTEELWKRVETKLDGKKQI